MTETEKLSFFLYLPILLSLLQEKLFFCNYLSYSLKFFFSLCLFLICNRRISKALKVVRGTREAE